MGSWTPIDGTHWPHIVLMSPAYMQGHRSPHRSEAPLQPTSAISDHHFSACMYHHDDVFAGFLCMITQHHFTTTSPPTPDHLPSSTSHHPTRAGVEGGRAQRHRSSVRDARTPGTPRVIVPTRRDRSISRGSRSDAAQQRGRKGAVLVHGGAARLMRLSFRSVRTCELQRG